MTLANNIIKFRKENNFTQEDLGKELGISRQSISKWENGGSLR
ncbi:helix-turn-helix transcriptional regulator [Enterococcus avium]|nr:helix-turn-helix transcriptional regulator [Enterococcus avium]MDT2382283.1 helix-turn-helix transcriptional regulator [Enterococcus avium]